VEFVGQALDSILPQMTDEVEIVVYDGGSTDSTASLMESYVSNSANLHYHRGAKRGGIDADLVKCVSFAQGEYCWLFSGDDVMRPKAIHKVLEWIERNHDVYICKHTICSKNMDVYHEHPVLKPDKAFVTNLNNPDERNEWFERAVTSEAFFSFISGLVVRREKWLSGQLPDEFNRSCWGHVARLFELIPTGLKVCYVPEVLLDQRGDNDSFRDKGIVNRFRIGIEGYHKLADIFFGHESKEAFNIRRVIRNEFPLASFLHAKLRCRNTPDIEDKQLLGDLINMAYCDTSLEGLRRRLCYYIFPYWLFVIIRPIYINARLFWRKIKNV
jgi:abequosyltransferase